MYNEGTTFRPRKGLSAQSYWEIRAWCDENGFSLSDVLNAILVPLAYYLVNYTTIDPKKELAVCTFNAGDVAIPHVFGNPPKKMPLNRDKALTHMEAMPREYITAAIEHWRERNQRHPEEYDLVILSRDAVEKNRKKSK